MIGAGLAGFAVAGQKASAGRSSASLIAGSAVAVGLLGYWFLSDAATTAIFDLKRRQIEISSARPWFGKPRTYDFSEVSALSAVNRSGESVDSWEAILEFNNGARIKLGRETEGSNERIRAYLSEIRLETGIAGN
jgi:hypothetical protein